MKVLLAIVYLLGSYLIVLHMSHENAMGILFILGLFHGVMWVVRYVTENREYWFIYGTSHLLLVGILATGWFVAAMVRYEQFREYMAMAFFG